jgi:serine/threonine protein kinase
MGFSVVCQTCGTRRTVPAHLYEEKIKGRVVKIPCRNCGATISVDGTIPPPAVVGDEDVEIPQMAKVPSEHEPNRGAAKANSSMNGTNNEPSSPDAAADGLPPPREKQISHVDGPISERGPAATVGRYALFEQFAVGGMATVHFGRLDGAGGFSRVVAIKRLLPEFVQNHEFTEMLLKEARLAARVRHPNVVATLDVVATKGDVLLVLDYVHGEALSTLCRTQAKQKKEHVPLAIAVGILLDMLLGLSAIHDATDEKGRSLSLVHRDISPPNVLVGADGIARVLDFGIATALEHVETVAPERRKGKRGYMSPEQVRGERLTQRSDVFAAGIVTWELLATHRLFPADQENEPGEALLRGDYPHPNQFRTELSDELDAVVMRAISLDPSDRYATIHELHDALEAAAPPRANSRRIGEWVLDLARDALAERTRKVARAENWVAEELPLKSTPFAAELPLRPQSPSSRPIEVFEGNVPLLDIPPASPLPASVSAAIAQRSEPPSSKQELANAKSQSKADKSESKKRKAEGEAVQTAPEPNKGSSVWIWLLLLAALAVAYFALRPH